MIEVSIHQNPIDTGVTVVAKVPSPVDAMQVDSAYDFMHEVVRLMAERYVAENYGDIVSKLDQQAIANLVIAESSKKIAEEIRLKPTVIREPGKQTTHNHYSIF